MLQIRVLATDGGVPQKTDTATVEVLIIRDRGTLRFGSSAYRASVSENREVNSEVTRVSVSPSVSPQTHVYHL